MKKYYLSANWCMRSAHLEELIEEILENFEGLEKEECIYTYTVPEDLFYKLKEQEDFIYNLDQKEVEEGGGKLETKLIKDENGENHISWSLEGFRYFITFEDLEEFEEFQSIFPEFNMTGYDEFVLGFPEIEEEDGHMELYMPICEECGGVCGLGEDDEL